MGRRAILVDVNQCIGCQMCVEGCQEANGHPVHVSEGFSEQSFTFLMDRGDDVYVRRLCMHCEDPSCVSVCPVAALIKEPQGQVTYNAGKCMGCRYCMLACPFGVPSYEWYSAMPRVRKCEMCVHRGDEGPACAEVCPTEATLWGDRDQLIAEAESRLANSPEEYYPYIYGLKEAGGTDVFFIGPRNPGELGLPQVGHTPMPELTWRALRFVPDVAIFGGVLLGGMFWLTKRKADVADAEHRQEAPRDR